MRIFLAGATGVIGSRLVSLLVAGGHDVAGMTRSPDKAGTVAALGSTPVVADVFDADATTHAVIDFAPDTLVHELTDLPDDAADLPSRRHGNARIRREGTANLLTAARAADVSRILAQSVAWEMDGEGGEAKTYLEEAVLAAGGVVLRYGQFYGPGTYYEQAPPAPPRIHIDDAARRTVELLDAPSGVATLVGK